jgi:hypothetical protein
LTGTVSNKPEGKLIRAVLVAICANTAAGQTTNRIGPAVERSRLSATRRTAVAMIAGRRSMFS